MNSLRCCERPALYEDMKNGDLVCVGCGLVYQDHLMAPGPEWNTYGGDEGSSVGCRVCAPIKWDEDGNARLELTQIGRASGTQASSFDVGRLRRTHRKMCEDEGLTETEVEKEAKGLTHVLEAHDYTADMRNMAVRMYKDLNEAKRVIHTDRFAVFAAIASIVSCASGVAGRKSIMDTSLEFGVQDYRKASEATSEIHRILGSSGAMNAARGAAGGKTRPYDRLLALRLTVEDRLKPHLTKLSDERALPVGVQFHKVMDVAKVIATTSGGAAASPLMSIDDLAVATVFMACICIAQVSGSFSPAYSSRIATVFNVSQRVLEEGMGRLIRAMDVRKTTGVYKDALASVAAPRARQPS